MIPVTNWYKWCKQHHIKIKGGEEEHDDKSDAGTNKSCVRGSNMAMSRTKNERQSNSSDL